MTIEERLDEATPLEDFNRRFNTGGIGLNAATLYPLYIPGYIESVQTPGAQVGVNYSLVNQNPEGLLVVLQAWQGMAEQDEYRVFWGSTTTPVVAGMVSAREVGQNIPLYIKADKVPVAVNPVFYTINGAKSRPLNVLVRLEFPGGTDPEPDKGGHQNLKPPQPAVSFIDAGAAKAGVKVTVPAYPKMREYDLIRLFLGKQAVEYRVQPADVGKPVELLLDEATIKAAGDGTAVILNYRVFDEVQNPSSERSESTTVRVELGSGTLLEPRILDAQGLPFADGVIDPLALGEDDVRLQVQIPTTGGPKKGDLIQPRWIGVNALGQVSEYLPEAQPVLRTPMELVFYVPAAQVQKIAGGQATADYSVSNTGQRSRQSFVRVLGAPARLPAPKVVEAADGSLDPGLETATVEIPGSALERNDRVLVTWTGTTVDQKPVLFERSVKISALQAGKTLRTVIDGAQFIAPLDGGGARVSYKLYKGGLEPALVSEQLYLSIGGVVDLLPAPSLEPQPVDGELTFKKLLNGLAVSIGYPDMALGDVVGLRWIDTQGKRWDDELDVDRFALQDGYVAFEVDADLLAPERAEGNVTLWYIVTRAGKTRTSEETTFHISEAQAIVLPDLRVPQAVDGKLDPVTVTGPVQVQIPDSAAFKVGDKLRVQWVGEKPGGVAPPLEQTVAVAGKGALVAFDNRYLQANADGNVVVSYSMIRNGREYPAKPLVVRVQSAAQPLPLPVFLEAVNGELNPDDVRSGATVLIDRSARLAVGDRVTVQLSSTAGSYQQPYDVVAGDLGNDLRIVVPHSIINAALGTQVTLKYRVDRAAGGSQDSNSNVYRIDRSIPVGPVRVLGARYSMNSNNGVRTSRVLTAVDTSGKLQLVEWRYAGTTGWTAGSTWMDRHPELELQVRSRTQAVSLSPANVVSNGYSQGYNAYLSAALVRRDLHFEGGVWRSDVLGWGHAAYGGKVPDAVSVLTDVTDVYSAHSGFAVRRSNGLVQSWGSVDLNLPAAERNTVFRLLRGNTAGFAAIRADGTLTYWGSTSCGKPAGDLTQFSDYKEVYPGASSFVAQRDNGRLVGWGRVGSVPPAIAQRTDVTFVKGNVEAFAARCTDNSLVAWGNANGGGSLPAYLTTLRDVVSLEAATRNAFCALRATGQVVAWGTSLSGGAVPAEIAALTDIVEVTATESAFCARRRSGHVVAWGSQGWGATVPDDIAQLSDIVQVTGNDGTFAALRANGQVVAWGSRSTGSNLTKVAPHLYDVVAVYPIPQGFVALTQDPQGREKSRVISWGYDGSIINAHLAQQLNGFVSYSKPIALPVDTANDL